MNSISKLKIELVKLLKLARSAENNVCTWDTFGEDREEILITKVSLRSRITTLEEALQALDRCAIHTFTKEPYFAPAIDDKCPECGAKLSYCVQGEYCTNCKYAY